MKRTQNAPFLLERTYNKFIIGKSLKYETFKMKVLPNVLSALCNTVLSLGLAGTVFIYPRSAEVCIQ